MEQVHYQEDIFEFDACVDCHPTGRTGEAKQIMAVIGKSQ
jgi:hypothetical protein